MKNIFEAGGGDEVTCGPVDVGAELSYPGAQELSCLKLVCGIYIETAPGSKSELS